VRVYDLGEGDPSYAVVACLHGDEPCGRRAVEFLQDRAPALAEPLRLVVANERAVAAGRRSVDEDLNRAFPGDPDGDTHESRLAAEVLAAVEGTTVLDLHSTVSGPEPFAVVGRTTDRSLALAAATGTDHAVDAGYLGGGLLAHVDGVAVECGLKGSDAAAGVAVRVLARFLTAAELLPSPAALLSGTDTVPAAPAGHRLPDRDTTPELFRIVGEAGRPGDAFTGENFERVAAGEAFARRDGEPVRADEPFYPVLMSTEGYDDKLGFRAVREGRLDTTA
jgi:hypothetical protein